eukprot:TRINITY_DN12211_c0_g2_i2.p1 TRINITY_DN12211_c0_g2~~TRINITY_DN12211_c0_g2_i2.p1  ORF type:complete len:906 (-),score=170.12 TRINITY_DN12211_c0_g2_i2:209-2890(-)
MYSASGHDNCREPIVPLSNMAAGTSCHKDRWQRRRCSVAVAVAAALGVGASTWTATGRTHGRAGGEAFSLPLPRDAERSPATELEAGFWEGAARSSSSSGSSSAPPADDGSIVAGAAVAAATSAAVLAAGLAAAAKVQARRQRAAVRGHASHTARAAQGGGGQGEPRRAPDAGRGLFVDVELQEVCDLPNADVASMDDFMRTHATDVCISAARLEPAACTPGAMYAWTEPVDIGPFHLQTRLTVQVGLVESKKVDMKILDVNPGMLNTKTGEVKLEPAMKPDQKVTNTFTWEDNGKGGLKLSVYSRNEFKASVPFWVPVPTKALEQVLGFFLGKLVGSTIKKCISQIDRDYHTWLKARVQPVAAPHRTAALAGETFPVRQQFSLVGSPAKGTSKRGAVRLQAFGGTGDVPASSSTSSASSSRAPSQSQRRQSSVATPEAPPIDFWEEEVSGKAERSEKAYDWFSQWYPVDFVETIDPIKPHKAQLLGMDLVVWNDGPVVNGEKQVGEWRVFEDTCPHRQGPLSEGVVTDDGDILCAYHGWRFGGSGDCSKLPYSSKEKDRCNCRAACRTFPVQVVDDMIFVFPQSGPEGHEKAKSVELPLIRELHDPEEKAHFTAAHHNTLGNRYSDPREFYFPIFEKLDEEGSFAVQGDLGKLEFCHPCLTKYHPDWESMPFKGSLVVATYCVPTKPGWVRPLATVIQNTEVKTDLTLATVALSLFMGPVPNWLRHISSTIVLHQDSGLLYGQYWNYHQHGYRPREEDSTNYGQLVYCPTSADRAVLNFRTWLRNRAGGGVPWTCPDVLPPKDTPDIYDMWKAHTKKCSYCQSAYSNLELLKFLCLAVFGAAVIFLPAGTERVVAAIASGAAAAALHSFTGLFKRYECSHAEQRGLNFFGTV